VWLARVAAAERLFRAGGQMWLPAPETHPREISKMKAFTYAALLTGFGAITLAGMLGSSVPTAAKCMVDEGNGRYVPCEEVFKPQKKATKRWRTAT
jgi:hypothetical protein